MSNAAEKNIDQPPYGFVEKILKLYEDPSAISRDFSDKEIALFIQFLIIGIDLNAKGVLQFNLNKELETYVKNFQLLDTSSEFFNFVRQDLEDLLNLDKDSSIENAYSFSDLINKFVKWNVKS